MWTLWNALPGERLWLEPKWLWRSDVVFAIVAAVDAAVDVALPRCRDRGTGWNGMGWEEMGSVGLGWFGMGWLGMGWVRMGWVGHAGMGWDALGWVGLGWKWMGSYVMGWEGGKGWDGMDGMGWNGMWCDGKGGRDGRVMCFCLVMSRCFYLFSHAASLPILICCLALLGQCPTQYGARGPTMFGNK